MNVKENLKQRIDDCIENQLFSIELGYGEIASAYCEIQNLENEKAKLEQRLERMTMLAGSLQEKLGKNV